MSPARKVGPRAVCSTRGRLTSWSPRPASVGGDSTSTVCRVGVSAGYVNIPVCGRRPLQSGTRYSSCLCGWRCHGVPARGPVIDCAKHLHFRTGVMLPLDAPLCSSIAIGNIGFRYGFDGVAVVGMVAEQARCPLPRIGVRSAKIFYSGGGRHSLLVCCIFFLTGTKSRGAGEMNYPQAVPQGRDVPGPESCCECVVQVPAPPSNGLTGHGVCVRKLKRVAVVGSVSEIDPVSAPRRTPAPRGPVHSSERRPPSRQSDPPATCPASSTTKTIPPTAWATPPSSSACGKGSFAASMPRNSSPHNARPVGTAATRANQLRIAARAHELVAAGTPLEAACRIIILEDQLAEACRINAELQQRDNGPGV